MGPGNHTLTILGCGGFIGSHLLDRVLSSTDCHVYGVDLSSSKIEHLLSHPNLTFLSLDVADTARVRGLVEKSDVVISLVALCNPSLYNTVPVSVIEANFLRPYEIARMCAELGKWLIHFSTSEVYGRTIAGYVRNAPPDPSLFVMSEDSTPLVLGPIQAQRWSYACAKQLLERAIYAFAFEKGLRFTIVRPFNFIGPRMDYIAGVDGEGVPRVLACFMESLLFHKPLRLVNGGLSRRCFTYIDDAVDAVMAMLSRPEAAGGEIFNVGNPATEVTMADLARTMVRIYREVRPELASCEFELKPVSSQDFYGPGYEDSDRRMPDIGKARELLGWEPRTGLDKALRLSIQSYVEQYAAAAECREAC